MYFEYINIIFKKKGKSVKCILNIINLALKEKSKSVPCVLDINLALELEL